MSQLIPLLIYITSTFWPGRPQQYLLSKLSLLGIGKNKERAKNICTWFCCCKRQCYFCLYLLKSHYIKYYSCRVTTSYRDTPIYTTTWMLKLPPFSAYLHEKIFYSMSELCLCKKVKSEISPLLEFWEVSLYYYRIYWIEYGGYFINICKKGNNIEIAWLGMKYFL